MIDPSVATGAQYVLDWAEQRPCAIAVADGATNITYAEMAGQLANVIKMLMAGGVAAGAVVGLECRSRYIRTLLALGCEALGATQVSLSASELENAAAPAALCQMFVAQQACHRVADAKPTIRIDRAFLANLAQPVTGEDLARLAVSHGPETGVRIARTSGATGAPKTMLRTRRMVNAAISMYDGALRPVDGDYNYVCGYSPEIGGVYTDVVRALRFGNKIWFVSSVDEFVAAAQAGNAYAYLLPRDAEHLAEKCRRASLNLNMYYVDITGSGVSPQLRAALNEWVTPWVANVYSSNETSMIATWEAENRYAIVPGVEVQIFGGDWTPKTPGETGRIGVRSPLVVDGYLGNPALTAEHFNAGWFLMSDLGFMPNPGALVVLGRCDDMLNIGGEKIAPYPIEQALRSVSGVADAVLLSVESAAAVGVMCAAVEPIPGADESALLKRVAQVMAQYARSFVFYIQAEFPRTHTGKVQRGALLALVEAGRALAREQDQR